MLKSNTPLLGKEAAETFIVTEGALWHAAVRLNEYLEEFSQTVETLYSNNVVIMIPRGRKGGHKFGYYFACFDTRKNTFLDGPQTRELLQSIYRSRAMRDESEFEVHDVSVPEKNLIYFSTVKEVLEIQKPPPAEWFRKKGPVVSDFIDKRVCPRKILDNIRAKVTSSSIFLLEGQAATGKSVVVRTLMYNLYKEGKTNIYYFDIALKRNFDESILVNEIRMLKGIFVIENIHLEPQKAQWIYLKLRGDSDRHILFTSRPSYVEFQNKYSEDLATINKITLEPFDEVDELIDWFCSHHSTPQVVAKKRRQIIKVAEKSFWLLAYALQGCARTQGKGKPITWIYQEVNSDLFNLENCGDLYASQYPCILLAISPLYKNETSTAEAYLLGNLKFKKAAINDLAKRGEITRQEPEKGIVFYGLPHSALADAYWAYGEQYKRQMNIHSYVNYLYDYSLSGASNCLKAVVTVEPCIKKDLLNRIIDNNKLKKLIVEEHSMHSVAVLAKDALAIHLNSEYFLKEKIPNVIADKIMSTEDYWGSGYCIQQFYKYDKQVGQTLWKLINVKKLAERLSTTEDYLSAWGCIHCLYNACKEAAKQLCDLLDLNKIVPRIMKERGNVRSKCDFFSVVNDASPQKGKTILSMLDYKRIADNLLNIKNTGELVISLRYVLCTSPIVCDMVLKNLSLKSLTRRLISCHDFRTIYICLILLNRSNPDKAFELSNLLPRESLVQLIRSYKYKNDLILNIEYLSRINKPLAEYLKKYI